MKSSEKILGTGALQMRRRWAMPNSNTFDIPCIRKLVFKYLKQGMYSIDPFANTSRIASVTNDLNPDHKADYALDALDFLKLFKENSVDLVLYDPPYSSRQVSECYKGVGMEVTNKTTQMSWRARHLDEIKRILKPNGILLCFGWNSNGAGIKRGFKMTEILLVVHGGSRNDTICTVETKFTAQLKLDL